MPLTFIDIEKQKTWRIGLFFIVLLFLYFCVTYALIQGIFFFVFPFLFFKTGSLSVLDNPLYLFIIFGFSLFLAIIHFWFSASDAVKSVIQNLGAIPPDPEDGIHRRLMNIMDEIHVVTNSKKKIQCMVIPSLSMNAIAIADLKGNSAIVITEGLISRLTRSQTEAVLAHETYHILSGDCMEATVATSLFGMYAAMIDKIQNLGEDDRRGLHPAFFLFWILLKLSQILHLFISREREYRADAASVRMTRNPIAMAEALHLIAYNWKGSGFIGTGLEMLCIMNPKEHDRDESEGFSANLMSTHPPIQKRIDILLKMARVDKTDLKNHLRPEYGTVIPESYYALGSNHQWQGPYHIEELTSLPWFSPQTWIKSDNKDDIKRASEDIELSTIFTVRLNQTIKELSPFKCPFCRQSLLEVPYEKTKVYECNFCRGVLIEDTKIPRIIARREKSITERIKSLAKAVMTDNQKNLSLKKLKGLETKTKPLISCPKCKHPMLRTFYSLAYLLEIDRCSLCNLAWFDVNEIEMLQCLIENKMTARLELFNSPYDMQ